MTKGVVVVGADPLTLATTDELRTHDIDVVRVTTDQLPDLSVTLAGGSFELEGRPIDSVLLREAVGATAAASFTVEDRGFVNAELSATWLAATQLDSVLAINCVDAEGWFDEGWAVWHRRLRAASVAVSPLSFGDCAPASYWRPYMGGGDRPVPVGAARRALGTALAQAPLAGRTLFACGEAVDEQPPPAVSMAAELLHRSGVQLKSIAYDVEGRVAAVDVFPALVGDLVESVARHLAAAFCDHLRSR